MSQGARTDLGARVHGNSGYRRGCRCQTCRTGHRDAERERTKKNRVGTVDRRAGRKITKMSPPKNAVPVDRIWPILEAWMEQHKQPRHWGDPHGGIIALARVARLDSRAIAIMRDQPWITFGKADRLLCAIGRVDAWHTDLADLYEQDAA